MFFQSCDDKKIIDDTNIYIYIKTWKIIYIYIVMEMNMNKILEIFYNKKEEKF